MYCVLNKVLQSDMGKTIVRKYAPTLDARSVWKDLRLTCPHHPKDSMKGIDCMPMHPLLSMIDHGKALRNNLFHFHEQFRQLDELTPLKKQLPHSFRLTLLQTAVRSVPELRIVKPWKSICP